MPTIIGAIKGKYDQLGGAGFLGQPLDIERPTYDSVGRAQEFEGGTIAWHPSLGAFTVYGSIRARWLELGREQFGYPVTDELGCPDGRGRANHFRQMQHEGGPWVSIYWTPETGAHETFGLIRNHWADLGWEKSVLGYPTTGELVCHDGVGRYQNFEGGIMVWHPDIGAFEVHGDILTRYGQLGGSAWGYPITDETSTPDKRGRFNHFRDVSSGAEKSLYWTQETGAQEVFGYIRHHWADLKWERSVLGYPTTGELVCHDGVGRYQNFEGGIMVWHPDTGAFEVHGDILSRYGQLGGSAWGYPITDESNASGGRFNHFREVPGGAEKSLYWTQETGAVEVYGGIRQRWSELGWEHSHLGFPVRPETDWPEGGSGARQQQFRGGRMVWTPATGSAPDPIVFHQGVRSKGLEAFGASVNVHLHYDGRLRFFGEATNGSRIQGYDYAINAMVRSPNVALLMRKSGSLPPRGFKDRIRRHWDETDHRTIVTKSFFDLQHATLEVHEKHEGDLTGIIDDVLTTLLAWTATAAAPGLFLVVYAGIEAGAVLSGGSAGAGLRIAAGTMWMWGPGGFMLAVAVDGLAAIGSRSRALSPKEYALADLVFKGSLRNQAIVLTDTRGGGGRPFTFPGVNGSSMNLHLGNCYTDTPNLASTAPCDPPKGKSYRALLIHELVHAWQFKHLGTDIAYVIDGILVRLQEAREGQEKTYDPGIIGKPWHEYNMEEQATIVEKWFSQYYNPNGSPTDDYGLASPAAIADKRFRYIAQNIRTGTT